MSLRSGLITLLCICLMVSGALCHTHSWEKTPTAKRTIVGTDHYGLPVFSPDTVYEFKTYWRYRPDSVLAYIRCSGCGRYERVYGRRTRGSVYFDSLNSVIDSILKHK